MIADIQSRIDSLSKSKKLPKNLDKAKLDSAKNGLDEVSKAWNEANQAFKKGRLADAFEKAKGAEKAGIERTRLHHLRHLAISLLLNSGADPFAVQKLAGHSDVRLATQTYAHVRAEALGREAGVLLTG
jgi:integrase